MNQNDPFRQFREMREAVERAFGPLQDIARSADQQHQILEHLREATALSAARAAEQIQEHFQRVAFPRPRFPEWSRIAEQFERLQERR